MTPFISTVHSAFTGERCTSPSHLKTFMSKIKEVNYPKNCQFLSGSVFPLAIKGV